MKTKRQSASGGKPRAPPKERFVFGVLPWVSVRARDGTARHFVLARVNLSTYKREWKADPLRARVREGESGAAAAARALCDDTHGLFSPTLLARALARQSPDSEGLFSVRLQGVPHDVLARVGANCRRLAGSKAMATPTDYLAVHECQGLVWVPLDTLQRAGSDPELRFGGDVEEGEGGGWCKAGRHLRDATKRTTAADVEGYEAVPVRTLAVDEARAEGVDTRLVLADKPVDNAGQGELVLCSEHIASESGRAALEEALAHVGFTQFPHERRRWVDPPSQHARVVEGVC